MLYSLLRIARVSAFISFFILLSNRSQAATFTVSVGDNFFSPKDITVHVGDTVTWVWTGFGQHDTVCPGVWSSGLGGRGKTFSFIFSPAVGAGKFSYFCTPHQSIGMVGSITVLAANQSPSVSLTAPGNNATFLTTDQITFSANASDADGTVSKVEFFSDGNLIGAADTTSPYSVTASLPAGQHTITAKATDNAGTATTSSAVTITVNTPANQPPTVSLTAPANGATFLTTDTITFSADASDDAGVNRVEFLSDGAIIGADTSAPYSVSVALPAGQHTITARAFDGPGLSTTTAGITITVNAPNQPPTVSLTAPSNGATFSTTDTITFNADASDDAGVNRVEFYSDGNLIETDTSAPYSVTATLAAGTHTITAKSFDGPGLSTTSAPIQIQVSATAVAPNINSVTRNGSTTTIVASASDGGVYDLQATTDFINWTVVDTKTAAGGTVTLTDTTSETLRFYRIAAH